MNPTKQEITTCRLCKKGFPLKDGVHFGTQSLGMIPATLCEAASGEDTAEWIAGQIDNGLARADIKQQIECAIEWAERRATALAATLVAQTTTPSIGRSLENILQCFKNGAMPDRSVVEEAERALLITPVSQWQPIESAPRDSERIILGNARHVYQGYWDCEVEDEGGRCWRIDDTDMQRFDVVFDADPTHWQPLPAPPVKEKQNGRTFER